MEHIETDQRPARVKRRWLIAAAAAGGLLAAAAVTFAVAGGSDLASHDPNGAKACDYLAGWIAGDKVGKDGRLIDPLEAGVVVAHWARQSTSTQLVAAVGTMTSADLPKVHQACVAAGADMPAYSEPR